MSASVWDSPNLFFCILVLFHPHVARWTFCFGKTCKARELNLNQTDVAPFQKHNSCVISLGTEDPKKPSCTLQDAKEVPANTSTCSCVAWTGCASRVPSSPWGLWLGRQPGQQLVPSIPPGLCLLVTASPAHLWQAAFPMSLHNRSLLAHPQRAEGKPSPPSPSSYPSTVPAKTQL